MTRRSGPGYCPRCGGWVVRDDSAGLVSARCVTCGLREDHPTGHRRQRRTSPKRLDALVPCSVLDCRGKVQTSETTTGRCHRCNRMMADWEKSAKTKPAPLIKVAGVWIFNPARSAAVSAAPSHKRKTRKAAKE